MKARFIDVGRGDKCWEAEVSDNPQEAGDQCLEQVYKSGALMSREIELVPAEFKEHGTAGLVVLVGGFRPVGRVEFVVPEGVSS